MHTVDRPTVEQLRREIERLDAAERLTAAPEEDEEEQEETGRRFPAERPQPEKIIRPGGEGPEVQSGQERGA